MSSGGPPLYLDFIERLVLPRTPSIRANTEMGRPQGLPTKGENRKPGVH